MRFLLLISFIFCSALIASAQNIGVDSVTFQGKKYESFELKSRWVYLDKELQEAKMIQYAEIIGYTHENNTIVFKSIDSKKKRTAKTGGLEFIKQGVEMFTTNYWPDVGEKVLVVVGKNGVVSLFATIQKGNYRFWSPEHAKGIALFFFKPPAMKLQGMIGIEATNTVDNYEACSDGCLYPVDALKFKTKQNNKK